MPTTIDDANKNANFKLGTKEAKKRNIIHRAVLIPPPASLEVLIVITTFLSATDARY